MKVNKFLCFLIILILSFSIIGCDKEKKPDTTLVFESPSGTGYYWDYELLSKDVISITREQQINENLTLGENIKTNFDVYVLTKGTAEAVFTSSRTFDDSITYNQKVIFTVDENYAISYEMQTKTVTIQPGGTGYDLSITDQNLCTWIDNDDGSYTFTAMTKGNATITFSKYNEESKIYYINILEDFSPSVTTGNKKVSGSTFETVEDLNLALGLNFVLPKDAIIGEISNVNDIGYVTFNWDMTDYIYVGGNIDLSSFFNDTATVEMINNFKVGYPEDKVNTVGYKKNNKSYYITGSEIETKDHLVLLMKEIL